MRKGPIIFAVLLVCLLVGLLGTWKAAVRLQAAVHTSTTSDRTASPRLDETPAAMALRPFLREASGFAPPPKAVAVPPRRPGQFTPAERRLAELRLQLSRLSDETLVRVRLTFRTSTDADAFLRADRGGTLDVRDGGILILTASCRTVKAWMERMPAGLDWFEPEGIPRLLNTVATNDIAAAPFLGTAVLDRAFGLDGRGELIAVIDTGLCGGTAETLHSDLGDSVFAMMTEPSSVAEGRISPIDTAGHGSHVAGSAVSRGPETRGAAPGALLVFQSIGTNLGITLAPRRSSHFERSVATGASVISCSWGTFEGGRLPSYNSISRDMDFFVWNHPEVLVCLAAGNDGAANASGKDLRPQTVQSVESCAKNILTVGAQESFRMDAMETYEYYGMRSADWIRDDYIARPFTGTAVGKALAPFSSCGPLADGRIAPMLLAPGTAIHSLSRYTSGTEMMSGTSMATPLVAGTAAVLRQYLREAEKIERPTSALLRAGLILSAESIAPGQHTLFTEIPATSPNNREGWGALRLNRRLTAGTFGCRDRISLANARQRESWTITLNAPGELSVVLSWIDCPESAYAFWRTVDLVNDYNLTVIAPDGTRYTCGDSVNTIERVTLPQAVAGTYTVEVSAAVIGQDGPGNLAAVAWSLPGPAAVTERPAPSEATVTLTVTCDESNRTPYASYSCWPQPGVRVLPKGIPLQFRSAARADDRTFGAFLTSSDGQAPIGWTLVTRSGKVKRGTDPNPVLTLTEDASFTWHRTFPPFVFSVR